MGTAKGPGPGLPPARLEGRHHLLGYPLELLEHRRLRSADRARKADVLHARVALFKTLPQLDQLRRRAGKPRAEVHIVLDRRHVGSRPTAAPRDRVDLVGGEPGHKAQRRKHLHVLFVDWGDLTDRLFATLREVNVQAELQVLAELEVLADPRRRIPITGNW